MKHEKLAKQGFLHEIWLETDGTQRTLRAWLEVTKGDSWWIDGSNNDSDIDPFKGEWT